MIIRGIESKRESNSSKKVYAHLVYNVNGEHKQAKTSELIIFLDKNLRGI